MKKVIAILMAVVMLFAFAACSKNPTTEENTTEENAVNTPVEETSEAAVSGDSVAQTLAAEFKTLAATETDAQKIADALAASDAVSAIGAATMPVDPGFLTGFDNAEIKGFDTGVMFAPMIGTIPFVGYVFALADGTDADAFVKTLEDNANLRWNICTQADEMVAVAEGNIVMFVMAPMAFEA